MKNQIYLPINKRPVNERPRERLWAFGPDRLHTSELLALLIRTGTRGKSAIQVAEDLLSAQKSGLASLSKCSPGDLCRHVGMGPANAAVIVAAFELARRAQLTSTSDKEIRLDTVTSVATYFRQNYGTSAPEKFAAFYINRHYRLLGEIEVARGSGNAVAVDPRRIFKEALLCNAKAVILAHNHPEGTTKPSQQDLDLTQELQKAGEIFRVPIVEHVIVTETSCFGLLS